MAKLDDLRPLVGTWSMNGRTLGADHDDITGTCTIDWAADENVLMFRGDQTIKDVHFQSLEVIWYDTESDELRGARLRRRCSARLPLGCR